MTRSISWLEDSKAVDGAIVAEIEEMRLRIVSAMKRT